MSKLSIYLWSTPIQLAPRGIEYSFTLVVSFHPIFVTKVDRAYRLRCFYMEAEKPVAQRLEVAMLPTIDVFQQFQMPTCRYHLRHGSRFGPPAQFVKVGEPVYHVWECDSRKFIDLGNDQLKVMSFHP